MATSTLLIALVVGAVVLLGIISSGTLPLPFRDRECQGRGWRRTFPSVPKQEIREFLSLFVKAFAFPEKERLKFGPDDKIFAIYRAIYPSRWTPDALEVETLAKDIENKYGLLLESIWSTDLTLGELFSKARGGSPT